MNLLLPKGFLNILNIAFYIWFMNAGGGGGGGGGGSGGGGGGGGGGGRKIRRLRITGSTSTNGVSQIICSSTTSNSN